MFSLIAIKGTIRLWSYILLVLFGLEPSSTVLTHCLMKTCVGTEARNMHTGHPDKEYNTYVSYRALISDFSIQLGNMYLCDELMSDTIRRCPPPAPLAPPPATLAAAAPSASPPPATAAASSAASLEIDDSGCSGRSTPLPFLLLVTDLASPPRTDAALPPRIILPTASTLVARRLLFWENVDSLLLAPPPRVEAICRQTHGELKICPPVCLMLSYPGVFWASFLVTREHAHTPFPSHVLLQ